MDGPGVSEDRADCEVESLRFLLILSMYVAMKNRLSQGGLIPLKGETRIPWGIKFPVSCETLSFGFAAEMEPYFSA